MNMMGELYNVTVHQLLNTNILHSQQLEAKLIRSPKIKI